MDQRLVDAQADYERAIRYAEPFTYFALRHIPKLIQIVIDSEKHNECLTRMLSGETLSPFDANEEG